MLKRVKLRKRLISYRRLTVTTVRLVYAEHYWYVPNIISYILKESKSFQMFIYLFKFLSPNDPNDRVLKTDQTLKTHMYFL